MRIIEHGNFARQTRIPLDEDTQFTGLNFSQEEPHTLVEFPGGAFVIFKDCNLTNCDCGQDVTMIDSPNPHIRRDPVMEEVEVVDEDGIVVFSGLVETGFMLTPVE